MFTIGAGVWGVKGRESVSLSVRQSVGERGLIWMGRIGDCGKDSSKGVWKVIASLWLTACHFLIDQCGSYFAHYVVDAFCTNAVALGRMFG